MELSQTKILILGHTHIPFVDEILNENGEQFLMLNSGSVGQPRDKDPRASFAVVNLDELTADIIRVNYDIEKVNERILDSGLPKILGERLFKGK